MRLLTRVYSTLRKHPDSSNADRLQQRWTHLLLRRSTLLPCPSTLKLISLLLASGASLCLVFYAWPPPPPPPKRKKWLPRHYSLDSTRHICANNQSKLAMQEKWFYNLCAWYLLGMCSKQFNKPAKIQALVGLKVSLFCFTS